MMPSANLTKGNVRGNGRAQPLTKRGTQAGAGCQLFQEIRHNFHLLCC